MIYIRRREFISTLLGGAAATWSLRSRAQQPGRMPRIIVLMGIANDLEGQQRVAAFGQGLQAAGWTERSNVQIDYHWVGGDADRARTYAAETVRAKPDVILANGTTVVAALQRETPTIPIVFVLGLDPVESGFVAGLAHPGGNITGFTTFEPEMGGNGSKYSRRLPLVSRGLHSSSTPQPSPPMQCSCGQSRQVLRRSQLSRSRHRFAASARSKMQWRRSGARPEAASSRCRTFSPRPMSMR